MANLSPTEATLRARLAAHTLHAHAEDPSAHTAPARAAFMARFKREADPDGSLPLAERARRAEHLKKAYFIRLSLKAAKARRMKKQAVAPDSPPSKER